jgi:DNA-directed RNA polymerase subunit RPC12/RpoP
VIRFRCPSCGNRLKVTGEKAGRPVTCPGCRERCVVPAESDGPETGGDGGPAVTSRCAEADQAPGLFAGMSRRVRRGVALLAVAAPLGLLLGVLHPLLPGGAGVSDAAAQWAMILGMCSLTALFTILYGQGTGCPSCGMWWSRMKYGTELAEREVVDKRGVSFGKSLLRITYVCKECGHRWQVSETEEYRVPAVGQPHRHGG